MIRWLRDRLRRRRYQRRGLFRYHDGRRARNADPFVIWRRIKEHDTLNLEDQASFVDQGLEPQTTIVIEGLCDVFQVTRFDDATGEGLMDVEVLDVLAKLHLFCDVVKKNSRPNVT